MPRNKTPVSKAATIEQVGEFWDSHDLTDHWDKTREVEGDFLIDSEAALVPVDATILAKIRKVARQRGISIETLVNLWLQEKTTKAA
jgi:hypothetical protein